MLGSCIERDIQYLRFCLVFNVNFFHHFDLRQVKKIAKTDKKFMNSICGTVERQKEINLISTWDHC